MITKNLIKIPEKGLDVIDEVGRNSGKKNVFLHYLGIVLESTPQKSDTETFLAHAIRERIDMLNGKMEIELEQSEISFIQGGIDELRKANRLVGSNWYYLIDALRSAKAE